MLTSAETGVHRAGVWLRPSRPHLGVCPAETSVQPESARFVTVTAACWKRLKCHQQNE